MALQVADLEVNYGKKQVIFGISLEVKDGEVVALVGPNGAGKSTTLHTILGLLHPRKGTIIYNGQDVSQRTSVENVKNGISLVSQGGRCFSALTVLENLQLGGHMYKSPNELNQKIRSVYEIFPILEERKYQRAGSLSGGERQMLAMGRALMSSPELFLLDEPSAGLSPLLAKEVMKTMKYLSTERGISTLIVEQNIREVFAVADQAYVMKVGQIVLHNDNPVSLIGDDEVRRSYLT